MTPGIRKYYIRYKDGQPDNEMHYLAEQGFRELGVETAPFSRDDDLVDLGPHVGVAGYIHDVRSALASLNKPMPAPEDYPEALHYLLNRKIEKTTIGKVRSTLVPTFIKPVAHKLFTGFVHRGDGESRMRLIQFCSAAEDHREVLASEVVDFAVEYRVFVLRGEILDVRRYRGDWGRALNRAVVEVAVENWQDAPAAYCLDFGLVDGETTLVEANDALAFGGYGLSGQNYARMLAARWSELVSQPDLPEPIKSWNVTVKGHVVI